MNRKEEIIYEFFNNLNQEPQLLLLYQELAALPIKERANQIKMVIKAILDAQGNNITNTRGTIYLIYRLAYESFKDVNWEEIVKEIK